MCVCVCADFCGCSVDFMYLFYVCFFHVCYSVFVLSCVLNALRSCTCCMEVFLRFISLIINQSINQSINQKIEKDTHMA